MPVAPTHIPSDFRADRHGPPLWTTLWRTLPKGLRIWRLLWISPDPETPPPSLKGYRDRAMLIIPMFSPGNDRVQWQNQTVFQRFFHRSPAGTRAAARLLPAGVRQQMEGRHVSILEGSLPPFRGQTGFSCLFPERLGEAARDGRP